MSYFQQVGLFSDCQKILSGQAQKAIFKLNRYLYTFTNITPKHRLELFDKLISPILTCNYCSEVWGFCHASQVERTHKLFCKQLLGFKTSTQNDFIYGELGRTNYYTRRLFSISKYWFKVISTKDRKYVKQIYYIMLVDIASNPNVKNWASVIKNTLFNLGFYHVSASQSVGNVKNFLTIFKQRLRDNFIQNWEERLHASNRADCYKEIASFGFQTYLDKLSIRKFRIALTRLRVTSHRLQIEAGRWSKPHSTPRNERLCIFYNKLEDELHLLFECTLYNQLRQELIKPFHTRRCSMHKAVMLMQSSNTKILKNLSVYVYKCFQIRNETLLNP